MPHVRNMSDQKEVADAFMKDYAAPYAAASKSALEKKEVADSAVAPAPAADETSKAAVEKPAASDDAQQLIVEQGSPGTGQLRLVSFVVASMFLGGLAFHTRRRW